MIDNIYQSFHLFVVFDTNMNFLRHSEMFKLGEKIHHEDSFDNIHYCTEMIIRNADYLKNWIERWTNRI